MPLLVLHFLNIGADHFKEGGSLADILANDVDDDGDAIRVIAIEQPDTGAVEVSLNVVSIPAPVALPTLVGGTYSATLADGGALPSWMSIDVATGTINATVPLDVLETLEIIVSVSNGAVTENAAITQLFDGNAGVEVTYTPVPGYSGPANFTYEITDDKEGNDTANVRINLAAVNDPPVARDDAFAGTEFTPLVLSFAQVLVNDTDVDGDTLTVTSVLNAVNGTVEIVNGKIVFSPQYDWAGVASFDYVVSDDGDGEDIGRVEIDVASTNDAPIAVTDVFDGIEDEPLIISWADLIGNDTDAQADDVVTFVEIIAPDSGGRFFELPSGNFQILSDEDFNGLVTYEYVITDGRDETTGTFTVNFVAVNDAPAVFDESGYQTDEDQPISIALSELLANDVDVEGDALSIVRVFDGVNGSVEMVGDQAVFTGRADYFGNAGFSYAVQDTSGAEIIGFVSLTVNPTDDLPIAVFDSGFMLDEDTHLDIDPAQLLANDFDPDGGPVSFVDFEPSPLITDLGNGLYRFTPEQRGGPSFSTILQPC